MIRFACPKCCTTFEVSDSKTGTKFSCDFCGQRIQVPPPPMTVSSPESSRQAVPPFADADLIQRKSVLVSTRTRPAAPSATRGISAVRLFVVLAGAVSVLLAIGGIIFLALASRPQSPQKPADGIAAPVTPPSATPGDSAARAQAVLKANCYRCHGENGTSEGGFNFILDRDKLVARKKIVPGDSAHSKLYRRVSQGEMPPVEESPRPGSEDVAMLRQWIDEGASALSPPTPCGAFLSDEQVVASLHEDLLGVPARDRKFIRYFTLAHLSNAHLSEDELQTYRNGLAKLINSLSWNKEVAPLRVVGPGATALRVDIRDYSWNDRVWSDVLSSYPYGVLQKSANAQDLFDAVGGRLSYVRADWFVATASRPPLYHNVLQLPDNERKLEDQLHIDVPLNIRQERVARSGFNGSGISRNNRLIERHESPYGSYWRSYDFADNLGVRNLFAYPLGQGSGASPPGADGGEIIFSLPNGLLAFMLVDAKGRRLAKASPAIVSDPHRPDRAVENGVSCMSCHARGLIPKSDQVRAHVERNPTAFTETEAETIRALYPPEATLQGLYAKDNARFQRAVALTGARLTATEPVACLVGQFEKELDMTTAAAELGLAPEELASRLDQSATMARTLGSLKVPGGTVQREVFTEAFPGLVRELNMGTYLAPKEVGR
jgi:mono/diheme cytochrome c family protein